MKPKTLLASTLLLLLTSTATYARQTVPYSFINDVRAVVRNSDNLVKKDNEYSYFVKYNDETVSILGKYGTSFKSYANYLTVTSPDATSKPGQCVSFVRAIQPGVGFAYTWRPESRISRKNLPQVGDIIATFSGNRYSGHAAIVVNVSNNAVGVIDQNFDWKGSVMIHNLYFSKSGVNSPSNYYIIK